MLVFVQKTIRTVPLPAKPQKPPKLQRCFIKDISTSFDESVNTYGVLTVEVSLYQTYIGQQFWAALRSGVSGGPKKVTKFIWPCLPTQLFYAVLLPCLSRPGQSIVIDKRTKGVEKRIVEEGDFDTLEKFTAFDKTHPGSGVDNCRVTVKKGIQFYNIITHFKATHVLKDGGDTQTATFEVTVCSLNPEAVTTLPASIAKSDANINTINRYCRSYPIRAKKAGISTDRGLLRICREHARANLRAAASSSNSSIVPPEATSTTGLTNGSSVSASQESEACNEEQQLAKRRKTNLPVHTSIATIDPAQLP